MLFRPTPLRHVSVVLLPLLITGPLFAAPQATFAATAPTTPPGFNVHLAQETPTGRFWRGGAPKPETIQALAKDAKARGVTVTFIDLRQPANKDDRSGKGGRLSPDAEKALATRLGLRYEAVNALDKGLPNRLTAALKQGDIYMHCMYGVNRTGFAAARYSVATGAKNPTTGLGKRDWKQGEAFQKRLRAD